MKGTNQLNRESRLQQDFLARSLTHHNQASVVRCTHQQLEDVPNRHWECLPQRHFGRTHPHL